MIGIICSTLLILWMLNTEQSVLCSGNRNFTLNTTEITWDEAKISCEVQGQRLAVLDTEEKIKIAASEINATFSRSWVGFSDIDNNGNEKWLTGDVVGSGGYDNWRSGNPDDGDEACGYVYSDWTWADQMCSRTNSFICEALSEEANVPQMLHARAHPNRTLSAKVQSLLECSLRCLDYKCIGFSYMIPQGGADCNVIMEESVMFQPLEGAEYFEENCD